MHLGERGDRARHPLGAAHPQVGRSREARLRRDLRGDVYRLGDLRPGGDPVARGDALERCHASCADGRTQGSDARQSCGRHRRGGAGGRRDGRLQHRQGACRARRGLCRARGAAGAQPWQAQARAQTRAGVGDCDRADGESGLTAHADAARQVDGGLGGQEPEFALGAHGGDHARWAARADDDGRGALAGVEGARLNAVGGCGGGGPQCGDRESGALCLADGLRIVFHRWRWIWSFPSRQLSCSVRSCIAG